MSKKNSNKYSSIELINFLKTVDIFSELSLTEIRKFINFLIIKKYKKNEIVFNEGDKGDALFIVKDGIVETIIKLKNGENKVIAEFKKGDFFGEMSIFDNANRSATCQIKEKTTLISLFASDFFKIIESNPAISIKIMYKMLYITILRLKESNQFLSDMVMWGEDARKRVITDPLTGVYNRRYLDDKLEDIFNNAVKENKPLTIVMSDLDHFRKINEFYSLSMGDRAIIEVANVFKKVIPSNHIIVRLGGDEYTIIMPDTTKEEAVNICKKACDEIKKIDILKDLDGPIKNFTLSLGIATYPLDSDDLNDLKQKADKALYIAKESGRDRVICF
ncbi:MAG TPA: GGDEF domain-containing protein [Spirochaetota bacterium]|nr:GGDEF domain-containing protein [Spirochaetota bacterium]HOL57889.1 GGDEF domain-containing protein [Spirochaetota bacterium]HPP05373.1 GGDEF domain-containing protein [Spirochaetota bacterium]